MNKNYYGKNVERMLENQETRNRKTTLGDILIIGSVGLLSNAIIFGGVLYGIHTSSQYQTEIADNTHYTNIVQHPESTKSLADSLHWKGR